MHLRGEETNIYWKHSVKETFKTWYEFSHSVLTMVMRKVLPSHFLDEETGSDRMGDLFLPLGTKRAAEIWVGLTNPVLF